MQQLLHQAKAQQQGAGAKQWQQQVRSSTTI
jgi:hypothetical protein